MIDFSSKQFEFTHFIYESRYSCYDKDINLKIINTHKFYLKDIVHPLKKYYECIECKTYLAYYTQVNCLYLFEHSTCCERLIRQII